LRVGVAMSIGDAAVTCIAGRSGESFKLPGVEGPLEKVKLGVEEELSSSTKVAAVNSSEGYSRGPECDAALLEGRLLVNQLPGILS